MKTSEKGINLIKSFEGCVLKVYLDAVGVPTCGYGHTTGLTRAMVGTPITQAQAEAYLKADLEKFEKAVDALGLNLNQNQHDALTSFAFNCGAGNLKKLCEGRTLSQIADKMLAYNKGGGRVLAGLTRRRNAERALFLTGVPDNHVDDPNRNPYSETTKNVRLNTRGNDARWLQVELNRKGYKLTVDGIVGTKTIEALRDYQKKAFPDTPTEWDEVCGEKTRKALKG